MGWPVQVPIPEGARNFSHLRNVQTGLLSSSEPWFFRRRESGRNLILTHPSSTEVKETVELHLFSPTCVHDVSKETFTVSFIYLNSGFECRTSSRIQAEISTTASLNSWLLSPFVFYTPTKKTVHNEIESLQRHAIGNSVFNVTSGVSI